ncbi:MAG: hypothetical protein J1E65_07470 [Lachnospiraceae bacterium]|nr:hypothetical protein [Lachnospiraceae bacterium]
MRRFRIGITIVLISLLTGCGNSTNISEEPPQTEMDSSNLNIENIVGESDSDDIAEDENHAEDIAEETDGSDDEDILYLKPCATYQDILDNAYEMILFGRTADKVVEADEIFSSVGIWEAGMGRDTNEALSAIGYTFYDVDGNGTEELIIADTGEGLWDNRILLMYTLCEDKPVLVIDGWVRNRYYLLNDGTIYNEGSSGAAYTEFGTYRIAEDGNSLEVIDYYYSGYYGDSVYGWFYNTTGEHTYDENAIIEFKDEDVPWNMMEDYIAQVKALELTFFEEYKENQ